MKHLPISLFVILTLLTLTSCGGNDEPKPVNTNTPRTILVYAVAANSLGASGYDYADIEEMQKAVAENDLNGCRLLVYHNSYDEGTALKEITGDGIKILKTYDEAVYSTSSARMTEVIADTKHFAPARDYGLVLWSHATGWIAPASDAEKSGAKWFGEDRNRNMSIPTLAKTLEGQGFSFIYFDCCFMANVESFYELRKCADYIIGSTIELPADGMPYDRNIPLFCLDTPDLSGACQNTFNYYNSLDAQFLRTCSMTLVKTSELDNLASVCRNIFALGNQLPEDFEPQTFQVNGDKYLFDLAQYMHILDPDNVHGIHLATAINKAVVYERHTDKVWGQLSLDNNCGLSCYIVNSADGSDYHGYNTLQWWRNVVNAN